MNLKFTPILKNSIFSLLICISSALTASVADDRFSANDIFKIEEQRLSETPKEILEQCIPKLNYNKDDAYLNRIQKLAYTFAVATINGGQKLKLLDESVWVINPVQRYQIRDWVQSHALFIKPNASCFSRYPYVLYNRETYQAVEAQFVEMPHDYNYYRQQIEKIDSYNRIIQLDDADKTIWQISFSDSGFNHWAEGDFIIVGVNNDWRIATYPHILINTSIKQAPYSEASFAGYAL